jgi:putative ABC transport system substrate-binding protein
VVVIVVAGGVGVRAVQQTTKTIPIVALAEHMLGAGLVTSLARPDGNTTGVSGFVPELDAKRVEILIEAVPTLQRMAALGEDSNTTVAKLDALKEAARAHNIELLIHLVTRGDEIAAAIDRGASIRCHRAERFGIAAHVCSSAPHYGPRRRAALAGNI